MYRERQFLRLFRYTRRQHERRGTVEGNQNWQKQIFVYWEGLFRKITELLQHWWQQNWIFILETLFQQKLSGVSFTDPTSTVGLQLLILWLLKVMFRRVNDGVTTIKPGHQTNENAWCGHMNRPSRCCLHQEEFTFGEHPRKPTIRNAWFKQWHTRKVLWWFRQQYQGIVLVPLLLFMAELLTAITWTFWVLWCSPWSRSYFRTMMQFSNKTMFTIRMLSASASNAAQHRYFV